MSSKKMCKIELIDGCQTGTQQIEVQATKDGIHWGKCKLLNLNSEKVSNPDKWLRTNQEFKIIKIN